MITDKEYRELKTMLDKLKEQEIKLQTSYENAMETLRKEYNSESPGAARQQLSKMMLLMKQEVKEHKKCVNEFRKDWNAKLKEFEEKSNGVPDKTKDSKRKKKRRTEKAKRRNQARSRR